MAIDDRLNLFYNEIRDDLCEIRDNFRDDPKLDKDEYAFLYWLLLKIYHLDESEVADCITEGNDGGIDCYVHYPESKELYIIQAKFYEPEHNTKAGDFSSFCMRPYSTLKKGAYKHNSDLQKFFTDAIVDTEYKIYFQFYSTSYHIPSEVQNTKETAFKDDNKALVTGEYIGLEKLREQFWGESMHPTSSLKFELRTVNMRSAARLSQQHLKDLPYKACYIFVPVLDIYRLRQQADEKEYKLFDENIREYLGQNSINKQIIDTLQNENERKNFVFFNNGITIICKNIGKITTQPDCSICPITDPQVVNGCQTVNAIHHVLDHAQKEERPLFNDTYVLVKILEVDRLNSKDQKFYHDVVRYSNSQNSIPSKVFATAEKPVFVRLQEELKEKGFLLQVKQSDKYKYKKYTKTEKSKLVNQAKNFLKFLPEDKDVKFGDICFDLEKFLQVLITFMRGGCFGFTKKAMILKPRSEYYENYSLRIQDYFSIENMIKLYFLYWRVEQERKQSEDKRYPITYYVIGFLGYHLTKNDDQNDRENKKCINAFLNRVFLPDMFEDTYQYLIDLVEDYREELENRLDYNRFIKLPVDENILNDLIKKRIKLEDRQKGVPGVVKYISKYSEGSKN